MEGGGRVSARSSAPIVSIPAAPTPIRLAFLGCGYITTVHSRHLRSLASDVVCSYASRDRTKAEAFQRRFQGAAAYGDYSSAIRSDAVDAVVIAVPPIYHLPLTLEALAAGKHVVVEKPAFLTMADYETALAARNAAGRVVIVGENDHYKPLAVRLRQLLADRVIGDMLFAHFTTLAHLPKKSDDWRNDESIAGGDAFFEEGIHWLHMAGSLGPTITKIHGYRPSISREGPDRRVKSMMVAFQYDNEAVGSLYYSREVPSLFRGLRLSKLFGRKGIISFESNGVIMLIRGAGWPRLVFPGFRDIRGYQAMYRDFVRAIRAGDQPQMSLERAIEDQRLMDQVYASAGPPPTPARY
jgi:predicted dehydrogenase